MSFRSDAKRLFGFAALFLAALIYAVAPANTYAQVAGATLTGTISDPSGAVIASASIAIKNEATAVVTNSVANSAGFYSVPNLTPGVYDVTAGAPGFKTETQVGITLTVGATQRFDLTLALGQATQKVTVNAEPPVVELATSSISATVNSTTIVELPLNGRSWTDLATLQPAVNTVMTQDPIGAIGPRGARGFGNQMSISGTRPQTNNYRIDGMSINTAVNGAPGSVLGIALGVDAIQEFSVLTANQSAEYGRTSGGVINAVTKSGTNQIHGDAYWFLRDEDFDAKNFFDKNVLPFHRNQFGASVGGPIQKDKTFFFFDYEGLRQVLGSTAVDIVPSQDARNGIIHNSDGTTSTLSIDSLVKPYIALWPLPNAGLIGPLNNAGHFDVPISQAGRDNFYTAKIDRKFSEKDSIAGTWLYDAGTIGQPDSLDNWINGDSTLELMVGLQETHIFSPTLVNSVRGGYQRANASQNSAVGAAINPLAASTELGILPGLPPPGLAVAGITTFNGFNGLTPGLFPYNSFQAYDDAFLIKGTHSLKFGFAFERMQDNHASGLHPNGFYTFGSWAQFLTNQPNTLSYQRGLATFEHRQSLFGGYIEDDWRLRPNLSLNLGLRYEMVTLLADAKNELANLRTLTSTDLHLGAPLTTNPTTRNFEPRVGLAWDPFHDSGKTAVRAAFGIFDILPLVDEFITGQNFSIPKFALISAGNLPTGSFPTGAVSLATSSSLINASYIQYNPPRNYVMMWNLNVERQLSPSTALTVGYVGNHGVHMLNREDDGNIVLPTATPQGFLWPFPAGSGTVLNPHVADMHQQWMGGTSLYDALEVTLSKKWSHGFQAQGAYTWGKNIDTGSNQTVGDPYLNSISSFPFIFCSVCRRGVSDLDIPQTLVINSVWDVPTPRNWESIGSHVLGGWQLGGIFTAEGGVPFTPLIGGDPLGLNSSDPYAFPNRLTGPGCASLVNPGNPNNYVKVNCFSLPMASGSLACSPFGAPTAPIAGTCANLLGNAGRNVLRGPGLVDFDFSLIKNNYIKRISENFNAQFRAEFFNILNRANFAAPLDNETLFGQNGSRLAGAGSVDTTSTAAREIQFALKVIW